MRFILDLKLYSSFITSRPGHTQLLSNAESPDMCAITVLLAHLDARGVSRQEYTARLSLLYKIQLGLMTLKTPAT